MYIARNKVDGQLRLFEYKPMRLRAEGIFISMMPYHRSMLLPKGLFPEVDWSTGPVRVRLVTDEIKKEGV